MFLCMIFDFLTYVLSRGFKFWPQGYEASDIELNVLVCFRFELSCPSTTKSYSWMTYWVWATPSCCWSPHSSPSPSQVCSWWCCKHSLGCSWTCRSAECRSHIRSSFSQSRSGSWTFQGSSPSAAHFLALNYCRVTVTVSVLRWCGGFLVQTLTGFLLLSWNL